MNRGIVFQKGSLYGIEQSDLTRKKTQEHVALLDGPAYTRIEQLEFDYGLAKPLCKSPDKRIHEPELPSTRTAHESGLPAGIVNKERQKPKGDGTE